ncbi:MAG: sulfotransferase family protein [Ponticaulis sp.]|nr:sulfotransferase family protein [Ponticaulis sp.]
MRIAMWSGPRNLSTATMRSFGARSDTVCIDEPFYAAYLSMTELEHPMREETLASQPHDPEAVIQAIAYEPVSAPILYQKHMTHHMLAGIPRDWMSAVRNAFLIRHPARVLASYARKSEDVKLSDIGFEQQADLFDHVLHLTGAAPTVVDSDDILKDPAGTLEKLCRRLEIPYSDEMLHWKAGPKPEDGAWAPHWYDSVNASTGFGDPPGPIPELPDELQPILEAALPIYETLAGHKV